MFNIPVEGRCGQLSQWRDAPLGNSGNEEKDLQWGDW